MKIHFFLISFIIASAQLFANNLIPARSVLASDDFISITDSTFGNYRIEKNLVTANQYAAFLNAVASHEDSHHLYKEEMSDLIIHDSSSSKNGDAYAVFPDQANEPISLVTLYDAMRYSNWVEHGQPTQAEVERILQQTGEEVSETGSYDFSYDGTHEMMTPRLNATYYLPMLDQVGSAFTQEKIMEGNFSEWTMSLSVSRNNEDLSNSENIVVHYVHGQAAEIENADPLEGGASLGFRLAAKALSSDSVKTHKKSSDCLHQESPQPSLSVTDRKNEEVALWSSIMIVTPTATSTVLIALEMASLTNPVTIGVMLGVVALHYYGTDYGWWY